MYKVANALFITNISPFPLLFFLTRNRDYLNTVLFKNFITTKIKTNHLGMRESGLQLSFCHKLPVWCWTNLLSLFLSPIFLQSESNDYLT